VPDAALVHEELAAARQIEVTIVVEVGPRGLAGRRQPPQPRPGRGVREREASVVAVQHRVVRSPERAVDGREEQVQVAIVVVVPRRRCGVGLLVEDPAGPHVLERMARVGAQVPQEARLGLVAPVVDMGEVAGEQVEVPVVVEVAPGGADGVAAVEALRGRHRVVARRVVAEVPGAVVQPQHVGLQPVVGGIDVRVAVLVEVARRDATGAVALVGPGHGEGAVACVPEGDAGIGDPRLPVLVPADVQVDEAIVVEVRPTGAPRHAPRQLGKRRLSEASAALVVVQPQRRPREQVGVAIVVVVRRHHRAHVRHPREGLCLAVPPHRPAGAEVDPTVVVDVEPAGRARVDREPQLGRAIYERDLGPRCASDRGDSDPAPAQPAPANAHPAPTFPLTHVS